MNRKPANPGELPLNNSIEETVREAVSTDSDVDSQRFEQDVLENVNARMLDFSGCVFRRVQFTEIHATRIYFSNCVFEQCDFSGMRFRDGTLNRVEFIGCRGIGSNMDRMKLKDVLFSECQLNYLNLSECKIERVEFTGCDMTSAMLFGTAQKDLKLANCKLNSVELNGTNLKNVDLTSCELEGLIAQTEALRGATISVSQAPLVLGIYGIRVRL